MIRRSFLSLLAGLIPASWLPAPKVAPRLGDVVMRRGRLMRFIGHCGVSGRPVYDPVRPLYPTEFWYECDGDFIKRYARTEKQPPA